MSVFSILMIDTKGVQVQVLSYGLFVVFKKTKKIYYTEILKFTFHCEYTRFSIIHAANSVVELDTLVCNVGSS